MSLIALSWAMEQFDLGTSEKMVLVVLANHHNAETGQCNPSIPRIAHYSGCSDRTVQRSLSELIKQGRIAISTASRFDGSQTSHAYDLLIGVSNCHPPVSQSHPPGATVSPLETVIETVVETPVAPAPSAKKKDERRITEVDDEFLVKLHARFDPAFGSTGVDERIADAKAHPNWRKYTDKQQYLTGWLRRDADRNPQRNGHRPATAIPGPTIEQLEDSVWRKENGYD